MSSYQTYTMAKQHCDSDVHEQCHTANTLQETHSSCKLLQIGGKGQECSDTEKQITDTARGRGNLRWAIGEGEVKSLRVHVSSESLRIREGPEQAVQEGEPISWKKAGEVRPSTPQVVTDSVEAVDAGVIDKVAGAAGGFGGASKGGNTSAEVLRLPGEYLQSSTRWLQSSAGVRGLPAEFLQSPASGLQSPGGRLRRSGLQLDGAGAVKTEKRRAGFEQWEAKSKSDFESGPREGDRLVKEPEVHATLTGVGGEGLRQHSHAERLACWARGKHLLTSQVDRLVRLLDQQHLRDLPVRKKSRKWHVVAKAENYRHHFYRRAAFILGWKEQQKFDQEFLDIVRDVWQD